MTKLRRIYSPEERAALTCGRLCGRSSLAQQDLLAKLGVPRGQTMTWTSYRAHREITRRLQARHDQIESQRKESSNRMHKNWNLRLKSLGLGVLRTRCAKPANAPSSPSQATT